MYRKNFPGRKMIRKELALGRQTASDLLSLQAKIDKAVPNSKEWQRLVERQAKGG